jgi:hypothetical protein
MTLQSIETLRQRAVEEVRALKRENAPRLSDTYWTSYTGYNYGRWADKGFNIVLSLLTNTQPLADEDGLGFLHRVIDLARAERDRYKIDAADEDGACSGAIDAAIWKLFALLPPSSPTPASQEPAQPEPGADVAWKMWYTDTFDREMPPQVETAGRGLIAGLGELWARFLFETVQPEGPLGFSRFHIQSDVGNIEIDGDQKGEIRRPVRGYRKEVDEELLRLVASVHAAHCADDPTGAQILSAAAAASDRRDFESRLEQLLDDQK